MSMTYTALLAILQALDEVALILSNIESNLCLFYNAIDWDTVLVAVSEIVNGIVSIASIVASLFI